MKRIPILIEKDAHEKLRNIAFNDNTSISHHIRKAVAEYLRKKEFTDDKV